MKKELIVIGGSAGSVDVVMNMVPQLPAIYPSAVVIVLHRKSMQDDLLLQLLQQRSKITVKEVVTNEPILPGIVYLAPPDYHLLIENDRTLTLDCSEKINHSRPSIDVTMESASDAYGNNLTGILLTGANKDGADGMKAIMDQGGHIIIQNPENAEVATMPQAAVDLTNGVVMDIPDITELLTRLNGNSSHNGK